MIFTSDLADTYKKSLNRAFEAGLTAYPQVEEDVYLVPSGEVVKTHSPEEVDEMVFQASLSTDPTPGIYMVMFDTNEKGHLSGYCECEGHSKWGKFCYHLAVAYYQRKFYRTEIRGRAA